MANKRVHIWLDAKYSFSEKELALMEYLQDEKTRKRKITLEKIDSSEKKTLNDLMPKHSSKSMGDKTVEIAQIDNDGNITLTSNGETVMDMYNKINNLSEKEEVQV